MVSSEPPRGVAEETPRGFRGDGRGTHLARARHPAVAGKEAGQRHGEHEGEEPADTLLRDMPLLATVVLYGVTVVGILFVTRIGV